MASWDLNDMEELGNSMSLQLQSLSKHKPILVGSVSTTDLEDIVEGGDIGRGTALVNSPSALKSEESHLDENQMRQYLDYLKNENDNNHSKL